MDALTLPRKAPKRYWRSALGCLLLALSSACDEDALKQPAPAGSGSGRPTALSPELRAKPLATVGKRVITLGEYAASAGRMDQFERMRYQSLDRRKLLLDEMIKVELLAQEARRRGLHKSPKTQSRIRQVLRDELLRAARADLPTPDQIPAKDVRGYYDKHRDEYQDPERRRVSHIVMSDKAAAAKVLKLAQKASAQEWGRLVHKHSLSKGPPPSPSSPLELAGDLGIVSAPGSKKGANNRVPPPLRQAVFKIEKIGGVNASLVEYRGRVHVVRLTGKTEARKRTFAEAERTIRVALVQNKMERLEKKLEQELRNRYKVTIDKAALAKVKVPSQKKKDGKAAPKKP